MVRLNLNPQFGARMAGMPRWAAWLTMAGSLVVGLTLFLLAASLALILIPVVMIVGAIAAWRLRSRMKSAGFGQGNPFERGPARQERVEVIDVEYRIIEPGEKPRG
jgi:hypothetical protein